MRAHVVSLAWGLVITAAVIDFGLTFDTRLFAPDFWDPTALRQIPSDFVMSPTYFLASVMLAMFWAILFNHLALNGLYCLKDSTSFLLYTVVACYHARESADFRPQHSLSPACIHTLDLSGRLVLLR